jgi:hypothetical protein
MRYAFRQGLGFRLHICLVLLRILGLIIGSFCILFCSSFLNNGAMSFIDMSAKKDVWGISWKTALSKHMYLDNQGGRN